MVLTFIGGERAFVPLAGAGFFLCTACTGFFGTLRARAFVVFMSALSVRVAFAYAAGGYFLT